MYNVVIVDDELDSQITLKSFLKEYCPETKLLASYSNVTDCINNMELETLDILLLDVNLSDGTGFDILQKLPHLDTRVIFVTAHEDFALDAFKYKADNYLLKPINPKQLQKAITEAIKVIVANKELQELKLLVDNLNEKKIGIPTKNDLNIINLKHLIRCEANGNYTYIFSESQDKMIVPKTIKIFDQLLSAKGFIRTHQSHLINQQWIRKIQRKSNVIELINNEIIPISRKYKANLVNAIKFKFI